MKVCFLMQDIGAVYGAERATLALARGLRGAGEEVDFLLIKETRLGLDGSGLEEAIREAAFSVHTVSTGRRFSRRLAGEIRHRVRGLRSEILHCVGPKATVYGGLASGWGDVVPVVTTVHGWLFRREWKERFYTWLEQRALKRFPAVVVLSTHYRDLLARVPVRHVHLIPSGIEPEQRAMPRASSGLRVGMMARFSEEKNHGMMVDALRELEEVTVLFAGEGPLRAALEARARKQGVAERIWFAGYLAREDFFRHIDVLALCSRIENLPFSVLEAMARGLPVVATRVGGLPELVDDGDTGFLVTPGDVAGWAEALRTLLGTPALRQKMGDAAQAKVRREFAVSKMVEAHQAMYRSLVCT